MKAIKYACVIVAFIAVILLMMYGCSVCNEVYIEAKETNMFETIQQTHSYDIVYHKDTKVMYAVCEAGNGVVIFNLLVNPDGTPMLWEG